MNWDIIEFHGLFLQQELKKLKQRGPVTLKDNEVAKNSTKLMNEHEKLRKNLSKVMYH